MSAREPIACTPRALPPDKWIAAARTAVRINPQNHAPLERLARVIASFTPTPERIAAVTARYWSAKGVRLGVGFLDAPSPALRKRILALMNGWSRAANASFAESHDSPAVRIAREPGGHWSYLGTDILHVEADEPTSNLAAVTESTPDAELQRVVRHQAGHALGFPHEHLRRELVGRIDPLQAIALFKSTQGWSADEVCQQMLIPIEEGSLWGVERADLDSIMAWQIPGALTRDGEPILGRSDLSASDRAFAALVYPKPGRPATAQRARGRS